jgi:Zn-dependent peptidase ImmA (M78 family)
MSNFVEQARRRAMHAAVREHASLKTDLTKRIDIFGILRQRELWVMFQPLDSLYGAYLHEREEHGVIINSKHPPHLQRFTTAHEYGHFVMKHGSSIDKGEQILPSRRSSTVQEVEAQTFAAHFLMPLQLVNTTLNLLGLPLKPSIMTPKQVYRLSLELGASYLAVVNHLVSLKKVSQEVAYELRRKAPKDIKIALGRGTSPQDSWADTWVFEKRDTGRRVSVYVNDELHVYLPEFPTVDHSWTITGLSNNISLLEENLDAEWLSSLELRQEESFGNRHFLFRAQLPGHTMLQLEQQSPQSERFELHIQILPRQIKGLSEEQKLLLALPLLETEE